MDIHKRYAQEIQHEIAFLTTGKANYAILSQSPIISEIFRTTKKRVHELWKDDSDNYQIRGWRLAILARMNSFYGGNWQEVSLRSLFTSIEDRR